jgi:hypothetical protein
VGSQVALPGMRAEAGGVSEPRQRGPRTPTVLKRLADLPTTTKGVPAAQYAQERAAARKRNIEARERRQDRQGESRATRVKVSMKNTTVTWLPEVAHIGGIRVCGVASDASDEVKRLYGVQV